MLRKLTVVLVIVVVLSAFAATAWAASGRNFIAPLTGADANHPNSPASGFAVFHLSRDGEELAYKLFVVNLSNVYVAHIHVRSTGQVVAWLYPEAPPTGTPPPSWKPGPFTGMLAEGVVTQSDLVGPLAGKTMDDLVARLRTDGAYVNVHTNDFVAPTNTGPGDFPGGEISGTIVVHDGDDDPGLSQGNDDGPSHDMDDDHGGH